MGFVRVPEGNDYKGEGRGWSEGESSPFIYKNAAPHSPWASSQMAYNEALAYAVSQKRLVLTSRVGESEAQAERSHNTVSSSARLS